MQHKLLFLQLLRADASVASILFLKQLDVICPVSRVNTAETTASLSGMCTRFRGYVDTICQDQTQFSLWLAQSSSLSHAFMIFRCLDCCFVLDISGISL